MRDQVRALIGAQTKIFCRRLWLEVTIVGRCIWSDDALDQATQLNALKWLNEIQHRVWGAHARDDSEALMWLLDQIVSHCDQAPVLNGHVRIALDRALAAAVNPHLDSSLGPEGNRPA